MFLFKYYRTGHNPLCLTYAVLCSIPIAYFVMSSMSEANIWSSIWLITYLVICTLLFPSAIFCWSWFGSVTKGHYDDQLILRYPRGMVYESRGSRSRRFSSLMANMFFMWPILFICLTLPLGIIGLIRAYFVSNHD